MFVRVRPRRCATRDHVMQSNAIDQSETIITKHHGGDEFLGCLFSIRSFVRLSRVKYTDFK
jgi:hypothetical protein